MKNTVLGSAVTIAWCVAAPFAQQPTAPAPKEAPAHNVFVLTGCLSAGAAAAATFKLTDASSIGQPIPARAREAGAVGTTGQPVSYELRPVTGVNSQGLDADALKAHVGQRVEVVVRPIESPGNAPTASLAGDQAAKPAASAPAPEPFSVTAIKRVSGTCP